MTDPVRTVAALLDTPLGGVLVCGTVMPWGNDAGPKPDTPARGWAEEDWVLPEQIADWARLRAEHPDAGLVVAGDFNMNSAGSTTTARREGASRFART